MLLAGEKVVSMHRSRSTHLGLVALATAFVLALVSFILPYVWDLVLTRGSVETFLGQSLRFFWAPASADLFLLVTAFLGIIGFTFIWRGRWEFGPEYASRVGLALLAILVAAIALAAWVASGVVLGLSTGFPGLIPWRGVLAFVGTGFLGFALYWILTNLPLHGSRPVAAVAFALGVAGGAVALLARLDVRRAQVTGTEGAGAALSLVSLILWFALCAWGARTLKAGRERPSSGAPARGA